VRGFTHAMSNVLKFRVCSSHEMLNMSNMEIHNLKLYDTLQIHFLLYDFLE